VFINLSKDMLGIDPHDGTTRQVSSYGRRERSYPGAAGAGLKKCVDLFPGKPFVAADLEGPGLITRIWVTLPPHINPGALRNVAVRMYWDDEDEPSVSVPLGDLFGATFARPVEFSSAYLSITSGACLCLFPMPFRRRARVVFENQGPHALRVFFFQVTWLDLHRDLERSAPYFHAAWRTSTMARGEAPFTVLDATGRGCYMGCHVDMQGLGFPWRANPLRWLIPEGFGMGMLEGWERMWIDRDPTGTPDVHGTGGEDYFNGAWYFTSVPCTTATHGVTRRSRPRRQVSCYRFHAEMPVSFEERIKVTLDHGLDNALPARYDCATFWYQSEPHAPLIELPGARKRRPSGGGKAMLTMSVPFLYAGAAAAVGRRIIGRTR